MSSLKAMEKRRLESLFGMQTGYILEFSNASFAEFFRDSAGIDIYCNKYEYGSGSKANRLRAFWEKEPDQTVGKILSEMLDIYRFEASQAGKSVNEEAFTQCKKITARLRGVGHPETNSEDDFLERDFGAISVKALKVEATLIPILESRIQEANGCLKAGASLAVVMLCGSVLEGVLLGYAQQNLKRFNQSASAPRDKEGKIRAFQFWTLGNFIDVAANIGLLKIDVKKFSHAMRDFRNYIHPYQQMTSGFHPDEHTAKICMQVLKAAIADLSKER